MKTNKRNLSIWDWLISRCIVRHYYANAWDAPSPKRIRVGALRRLRAFFRSDRWGPYFGHIRHLRHVERHLKPEACQQRRDEIKAVWQKRRGEPVAENSK